MRFDQKHRWIVYMAIGNYLSGQGKSDEAEHWYDRVLLQAAQNRANGEAESLECPDWHTLEARQD